MRKGFSLLEVLIALAILAVAATALIGASGQNVRQQAYLKNKTFASLIAENTITEMRAGRQWPETGKINKTEEMAGQKWDVAVSILATEDSDIRRADISVSSQATRVKASLTGYLGRN